MNEKGFADRLDARGTERSYRLVCLTQANRIAIETYPRPANLPYNAAHPIPEGRPTGGMSFGGVGAAPAGGFAPHSREASGTDLGTLRSLREELARPRRLHKPA